MGLKKNIIRSCGAYKYAVSLRLNFELRRSAKLKKNSNRHMRLSREVYAISNMAEHYFLENTNM